MNTSKAQSLLLKIQTFLEMGNGHELSRLEKDLMKSYIIQLYDAVSAEESDAPSMTTSPLASKPVEQVYIPRPIEPKIVQSPPPSVGNNGSSQFTAPEIKEVPPTPAPVPVEAPVPELVVEQIIPPAPVAKEIPLTKPVEAKGVASEDLVKLFELNHPSEMDSRFSHVPITDIAMALGLNERIFTLNVLFGGDRELFDNTCHELNNLKSFSEATDILLGGPARKFNWADRESLKMAEHFIRTVARRYPQV